MIQNTAIIVLEVEVVVGIVVEAKAILDGSVVIVGFVDIALGPVDVEVENFVFIVFIVTVLMVGGISVQTCFIFFFASSFLKFQHHMNIHTICKKCMHSEKSFAI